MKFRGRWLVTGATGLVGGAVCTAASLRGIEVIGLSRRNGLGHIRFDLRDVGGIPALLEKVAPDCIVHLAAVARPAEVEQQIEVATQLNVVATRVIAEWCKANDCYLIVTSTDLVFGGSGGPYRETDMPRPATRYGQLKLEAEAATLDNGGTVARLGWVLNDSSLDKVDFIQQGLAKLRDGETIVAVDDEHRSPIFSSLVAEHLARLTEIRYRGLIHVAGEDHTTAFNLLTQAARQRGLPAQLIQRGSRRDLLPKGRPADVRLDTSLIRSIFAARSPASELPVTTA